MTKKFLTSITLPADPTAPLEAATKQYVDSGAGGGISQATADARYLQLTGGTLTAGALGFGSRFGQHLNMYSTTNGMGVQNGAQYQRVGSSSAYCWYRGGVHADTPRDPGAGGVEVMYLDNVGTLTTLNGFLANRSGSPATKYLRIYDDELFAWDAGAVAPLKIQRAGGTTTFLGPVTLAGAPTVDLHAATKKYADDGDAVMLYSANTFTNDSAVSVSGDTMTGVLNIDMPTGTTPIICTTAAATANYIPFYQAATRRGYVGVFPADGSQIRLYADTGDVNIRGTAAVTFNVGATGEVGRVADNAIVVGKTNTTMATVGAYMSIGGQIACTIGSNVDQIVANAVNTAIVTGHDFFSARNDNVVRGTIRATAGGVAFNVTSDYRKKNVLGVIPNATERLLQLKPVSFEWKEAPGSIDEGFIAHEVAEAVPYAVSGEKDGEKPQQLDYSKLTPLLTAVVQELVHRVSALEGGQ